MSTDDSPATDEIERLRAALTELRDRIKNHPAEANARAKHD
jgi:hypothetical protein